MKFKIFVALLTVIITTVSGASAFSQYIQKSDYNAFTGEHHIQTTIVTLKRGFSSGFGVSMRVYGPNVYLSVIGFGKKSPSISEHQKLHFVLEDGKTVQFNTRVFFPVHHSDVPNNYVHHFAVSRLEIEALTKSPVKYVRIVSLVGQRPIEIAKKQALNLVKLSEGFLNEMNKF